MNYIKSLLISSVFISTYIFAQSDSYVVDNVVVFPNAFNTTEAEFFSGFPYEVNGTGSLAIWGFDRASNMRAYLSYVDIYQDELERDILHQEVSRAERVACPMNEDRTDNKAYMVVTFTDLSFRLPDQTRYSHFYNGDVVGGTDWNNNGEIDVLENISELSLHVQFGQRYPSVCNITLR